MPTPPGTAVPTAPASVTPAVGDSSSPAVTYRATHDRLTCTFPSHPVHLSEVRRAVEKFCRATPLDEPACDELGLVVNEATANVIRHAYAGATDRPIEVTVERFGDGVRIAIRDWGTGKVPKPSDNPATADPLMPGGLGLICLRRLTDEAKFEPQPGGGMKLTVVRTTPGLLSTTCENPLCDEHP